VRVFAHRRLAAAPGRVGLPEPFERLEPYDLCGAVELSLGIARSVLADPIQRGAGVAGEQRIRVGAKGARMLFSIESC